MKKGSWYNAEIIERAYPKVDTDALQGVHKTIDHILDISVEKMNEKFVNKNKKSHNARTAFNIAQSLANVACLIKD